ncbi:MAG TPA: high-potential iron-sulfur protein [Steroidobacteraceae bacterium]|jgi:hypothetical protein|nr:high-potential iron-sulfur protein [Steroidobacteraceae bacterium]
MRKPHCPSRRRLLRGLALGVPLVSLALTRASRAAAPLPLLGVNAPEAKAVQYVEDASRAGPAAAGNSCANCALYQGPEGASQGPCQLFPGKDVKAKGWCRSWAPQM